MLEITIPATKVELFDEATETFYNLDVKEQKLQLQHSLVSLQKWESKWHKAFLSKRDKTTEEIIDYVKCMTLTQNVHPDVYQCLTQENFADIQKYIEDPMTATYFSDDKTGKSNNEVITAELVYYWMITLNIPPEYRKWHLNSLLALIQVCNRKNQPPKKMSKGDIMRRNASLNAARRKQLNTRG